MFVDAWFSVNILLKLPASEHAALKYQKAGAGEGSNG